MIKCYYLRGVAPPKPPQKTHFLPSSSAANQTIFLPSSLPQLQSALPPFLRSNALQACNDRNLLYYSYIVLIFYEVSTSIPPGGQDVMRDRRGVSSENVRGSTVYESTNAIRLCHQVVNMIPVLCFCYHVKKSCMLTIKRVLGCC